jgi:hypothetical protein
LSAESHTAIARLRKRGSGPTSPLPSLQQRSTAEALGTVGLTALFAASALILLFGFAVDAGAIRFVGLFGALFFGVGTAPLLRSADASLSLKLGVATVVALSTLFVVGSIMVLAPLWVPVPAAIVIVAAAGAVHIRACRDAIPQLRGNFVLPPRTATLRALATDRSLGTTAVGTVLWLTVAIATGHVVPGVGGFITVISPLWFAGVVLVLVGIVLARGKSEWYVIVALISLVCALTLTPALVYGMSRSQSASKHIEIIQQILRSHYLDRHAGIYDTYSGFFNGIAWLCDIGRIRDSAGLAAYWPLVMGLARLAALRFFFRRVISSPYRIWAATTLVVLVDSIGADYFSPQAVGYILALGVFGLAMGQSKPGLSERGRIGLLVFAGCALAVSHELSPFITAGVLVVLVVFGSVRPRWLPATLIVPAGGWAILNHGVLSGFVSLADLGNLSNFVPPQTVTAPGLQRLSIVGDTSHALLAGLLALILLALAGLARTSRRRASWGFIISAGVGLLFIAINPYGNEGIFRSALFGIPWLAILATASVRARPPRWVSAAFLAITLGLLFTFLVSSFGLDNADVIRSADLQAFRDYEARAPAGYLLNLSYGDIPRDVTSTVAENRLLEWTQFVTPATFPANRPNASDAVTLAARLARYGAGHDGDRRQLYAEWSTAGVAWGVNYGLESRAHALAWRRVLARSPDWRVVYHADGTYLFSVVLPLPVSPRAGGLRSVP